MYIFSDFKYHGYSRFEIMYSIFLRRGVSAVFLYRLSNWLYIHKLKFLAILLYQLNVLLNCCEIAIGAEIGRGFKIVHPVGVVIGSVKAGENLTVYQNVTIGKNRKVAADGRTGPIIENNVTLYTGSVITGPIRLGNNVVIGANSVVQSDIADNSKVIGQKPIVIDAF